jgi:hypothetical protein
LHQTLATFSGRSNDGLTQVTKITIPEECWYFIVSLVDLKKNVDCFGSACLKNGNIVVVGEQQRGSIMIPQ